MTDIRNKEQQLRRALRKAGYRLCKSRSQKIHAYNLGGYNIIQCDINACVGGGGNYGFEIEDVAEFVDMFC